jgi:multidrug efflux system membrane fusion protein
MTKNLSFNFVLYLIVIVFLSIAGCSKKEVKHEIPPRPVETAVADQKDVPIYIDSFGSLTSINNVDIKSQVTGKILDAHFKEGDMVKKGDLLFSIDPSEFKANLDKAVAAVAQDTADLKMKRDTLERNRKLVEQNLVSKQDFEKYETDVTSAEAKLSLDQANVELEKINLEYCSIKSPIDGITGKRLVDPGNIVPANTGATLVNIKSIDPLYVDFTIIERDLERARSSMAESKLTVQIITDDGNKYSGSLEFLDNAVDNTTGTISLRATIPNPDKKLWSGQFVRVRLILGIEKNAVIVPYSAVQIGQKGYYLFAVTSDNKADLRFVKVGSRQEDDIVIKDGVKSGEKIVTVGQMGLAPGVSVMDKLQMQAMMAQQQSQAAEQKKK